MYNANAKGTHYIPK